MNVESNENKSNFLAFTIAGEITVGTSAAKYLFSSVATLSEDAASTNNRDTISGLTKLVIVVGCIGVLIICLHFFYVCVKTLADHQTSSYFSQLYKYVLYNLSLPNNNVKYVILQCRLLEFATHESRHPS